MGSNWTKQPMQLNQQRYLNGGSGDSVIGGLITSVPSGVAANQGIQDVPGDRIIFGQADAYALSNTTIGTLYAGLYQYVTTKAASTAAPTLGKIAFGYDAGGFTTNNYTVTPDELAGAKMGWYINTLTKGYSWWILVAGIVKARFKATLTGTATANAGVFAAMAGSGEPGVVNQFVGQSTAVTTGGANNVGIDSLLANYAGTALELPVAGGLKLIEVPLGKIRF